MSQQLIQLWFILALLAGVLSQQSTLQQWLRKYGIQIHCCYIFIVIATLSGFLVIGLYDLWNLKVFTYYQLAGLFPNSDADGYVSGALKFNIVGHLAEWNSRRPLHTLWLATLVNFAANNFYKIQIFSGLLLMLGCCAVAISLLRKVSVSSAFYATGILAAFVLFQSGLGTLSETSGFLLGTCSFVLILCAIERQHFPFFLLGTFLAALGHCSRAGALFVLLAYIFPISSLALNSKHKRYKAPLLTITVVVAAFFINAMIKRYFGHSDQVLFSNFMYTLYGIASGGQHWTKVFVDYPVLSTLHESDQASFIFQLVKELGVTRPDLFVLGLFRSFSEVMFEGGISSFIPGSTGGLLVLIPFWVGFATCYRNRDKNYERALFFMTIGLLVSAPFLCDDPARLFAVDLPLIATLCAYGIHSICRRNFKLEFNKSSPDLFANVTVCLSILLSLSFALFVGAALLWQPPTAPSFGTDLSSSCNGDERYQGRSFIIEPVLQLFPDVQLAATDSPNIRISDWNDIVDQIDYGFHIYQNEPMKMAYIFSPETLLATRIIYPSTQSIDYVDPLCVKPHLDPNLNRYKSNLQSARIIVNALH